MIEYLKGEITELDPTHAVVECGGVGYGCAITLYTYDQLRVGTEAKLYVAEVIREDAHLLYGFVSRQERAIYEMLVSVSGVGPGTARVILSSLSPDELVAAVSTGDEKPLKNVKGIGGKTAQRIIVDLRDKISQTGIVPATSMGANTTASAAARAAAGDAVASLVALGYPAAAAQKVVDAMLAEDPTLTVQALIKAGLQKL